MPSRPDLRDIASNVKEAFADADRDTLLEVLTYVVKEYVVEGPPPMLIHQAETLSDLQGASFATLITTLQTRFEFPELAMFVVDGESVGVRVGGAVQPLIGQRTPLAAPPAQAPPPQPGVRVVETAVQQRAPAATPAQQGSAPPPARGVSMRGRPTGDEPGAPAPAPAASPGPSAPATPPASAAPVAADKPEGTGGDDASARFSLLELD